MGNRRLIAGVGINDSDYKVHSYEYNNGVRSYLRTCTFYATWMSMLDRCYRSKCQTRRPEYIGCSVAEEWFSFMAFRAWMISQDWNGKHLDKDLLVPGNKLYSPDTCIFLPHKINAFLIASKKRKGDWPTGVTFNKEFGRFVAMCHSPITKKNEFLGKFSCPNQAHEAWRAKKHEHACRYADEQTDQRIAEALRTRYTNKEHSI